MISFKKVGSLVEVQADTNTPDIVPNDCFKFDKRSNGLRVVGLKGVNLDSVYPYAEIEVEGVACSGYDDFKTKIAAVFPEAGQSAGTPGIDDVLAEEQALTADRTITMPANRLFEIVGPFQDILHFDTTTNAEEGELMCYNNTGGGNRGQFFCNTTNLIGEAFIRADFNDGEKRATILAHADASESTLTHTADSNIFNGAIQMGGNSLNNVGGVNMAQGGTIKMKSPDASTWALSINDAGELVITED